VHGDKGIDLGTLRRQVGNGQAEGRRININEARHAAGRPDCLEHYRAAIKGDANPGAGPQLERSNCEDNTGPG